METNDKELKENVLNTIEELEKTFFKNQEIIRLGTNGDLSIPNIGTILNNKINEIYRMYNNKNKKLYTSNLFSLMYNYLIKKSLKANAIFIQLSIFIKSNATKKNIKRNTQKLYETIEAYLQEYRKISDEIYNFSIEKDIVDAFNMEIERNEKIEETGAFTDFTFNKDKYIDGYNEELKELGYNITLKMANEKKQGL